MGYVGDFNTNVVYNKKFTTVSAGGTASTLLNPTAAIYPDASTTEITAGITITTDFDGIIGYNNFQVDFSQSASYAAGGNYNAMLLGGTAGGNYLRGYEIFDFSIRNRYGAAGATATIDANVISIDGKLTTGNNATLNLKQLSIINSAGSALVAQSTGGNGSGILATGHETGSGILGQGGNTASGISGIGGITSGAGIAGEGQGNQAEGIVGSAEPGSNGYGIAAYGDGSGDGIIALGGVSGVDIRGNLAGTVSSLSVGERNEVADAFLNRDMSIGTDSGTSIIRTTRQALRFLRNKWGSITTGGTFAVYKEDDVTESWVGTVASTSSANPIIGVDPAGP